MTTTSISAYRQRRDDAAEAVYADIERDIRAARDTIMARAMRRLAKADPQATLTPMVNRLGRAWADAWPFDVDSPP